MAGAPGAFGRLRRRLGAWRVGLATRTAAIALYVRLVNATTRWRVEGRAHHDRLLAEGSGVIMVAWHGRLFMVPCWSDPERRRIGIISANRDGDLIAGVLARFRIRAVRGSSHDRAKRRGKGALRAYIGARRALLDQNAILGITPDGPRGPRMRAQPGVAQLSIETGCKVLPVTFSTCRGRVLGSWDRFLLPFPFGRGVQIWGKPLCPPAPGDACATARYLAEIEAALTAITAHADQLCGRVPVAAAAAKPSGRVPVMGSPAALS